MGITQSTSQYESEKTFLCGHRAIYQTLTAIIWDQPATDLLTLTTREVLDTVPESSFQVDFVYTLEDFRNVLKYYVETNPPHLIDQISTICSFAVLYYKKHPASVTILTWIIAEELSLPWTIYL